MEKSLEETTKKYFEGLLNRIKEIDALFSGGTSDTSSYINLAKEKNKILPLVETYNRFCSICRQYEDTEQLLSTVQEDQQIIELAREELTSLQNEKAEILTKLEDFLIGEKKEENQNIILEIRAGTGGAEAALFVADLCRMYNRYAQSKGWKWESMDTHPSEFGGLKEVVISIEGESVYNLMKHESGVHRVQRVPVTEAGGRIHTSTASVAVMQEAEDIDIKIDPKDIKIDVYRSGGKGGQGVNTTDSAVRLTHVPSKMVVTCQDERSQLKNKNRAMKVLRARLYDLYKKEQEKELAKTRKLQIGSAERSEKIRTYNFSEHRITDHRIGLTVYRLQEVMDGNLDIILEPLLTFAREEQLKKILV